MRKMRNRECDGGRGERWKAFCAWLPLLVWTVSVQLIAAPGQKWNGRYVELEPSRSAVLEFPASIAKVFVADPEIADVTVTTPRHLLVVGKKVGTTNVVVWTNETSYQEYTVEVTRKESAEQVMLQVRFAEMTRGALRELGAHFIIEQLRVGSEQLTAGSFAGRVNTPQIPPVVDENVSFFFSIPSQKLSSVIRALEERRVLTTLAEPNLVAANGDTASFLAGGEFPVPIVNFQGVTIVFKEFGVRLRFVPTILDSETIQLRVAPEVSSLDFENGIILNGFRIPSLLSRRASTTVHLKDGEGLVIGGLMTREMINTMSRIPVLGHIPILGNLFKSKRAGTEESELIILIVPHIVKPMRPAEVEEIRTE
ncbi:MAG: pilus assembly protein N-terminal domain-containing protein [candidate division KSB1 bacterium]|nr:pilus assembly protein N-terminal domain-containing protein [candidate division KSB1 bacterium]MDZ7294002.1 pilus assembly protein N-terminal domain-containing protein [candidate division KSB1 bacterium]MDZ7385375.1 pilus assembly protein N-terminal domain-containing protein [candidate division KSB1 bacterium]